MRIKIPYMPPRRKRYSIIIDLVLWGFHQFEYHTKDDLGCQGTLVPHLSNLAPFPV